MSPETRIDVRQFIQNNYTPYEGNRDFLAPPTTRTLNLLKHLDENYFTPEREAPGKVLDVDTHTPSGITAFPAGYIDKDTELIVGLQTDKPLKRAMMPNGGWRMVETALKEVGREPDPTIANVFTKHRKTHNQGVFDAYTPRIRAARSAHIITGLPDSYGRGRIIGDYRRVALYGVDALIEQKRRDKDSLVGFSEDIVRAREEHAEQIRALGELVELGDAYGLDLRRPALSAREAVQWLYMGYLGAVKTQDGAAMSVGRVSAFLDVFFERDLRAGVLDEQGAQELIDDFVLKLRLVRFLRTDAYNAVFAGDPVWATLTLGGMGVDGRTLVTKTDFRFLHTLFTLGNSPEPNLTVLWSSRLPVGFKEFCAHVSVATSAIQYENDDEIRGAWGDDAAIACCVSPMRVGKQMQFFGARVNLVKTLLYAINGGRDEVTGKQVIDGDVLPAVTVDPSRPLNYTQVREAFAATLEWVIETYVEALNIIHYMHDKYAYEALEMALHDRDVLRTLACGIAGLSHVVDSLSAIRSADVYPVVEGGLVTGYRVEGDFPRYGNDDDVVDGLMSDVVGSAIRLIRAQPMYRGALPTQSVLTITSNVVYGLATGSSPDGRVAGEPFAPGANPSYGAEVRGPLASMLSVAKIPYADAQDGSSLTIALAPGSLGRSAGERVGSLVGLLDAGFSSGLYHANVNVFGRELLEDAFAHPELYPNLVLRVSGYALFWAKATQAQREDILRRTIF